MALETYRHWRMEQDGDRIAWVTFDRAERSVNALSRGTGKLSLILDTFPGKPAGWWYAPARRTASLQGGHHGIYGLADGIRLALIERGQRSSIVSKLPFRHRPHSRLLPGWAGLALACRYRIAADNPETRLGFPR
jgi:3-hydroxyacyl-CoA dehydrogenase/enoyl-CoA hydratase/3-hydroxybutyryl-CoA epimerase